MSDGCSLVKHFRYCIWYAVHLVNIKFGEFQIDKHSQFGDQGDIKYRLSD